VCNMGWCGGDLHAPVVWHGKGAVCGMVGLAHHGGAVSQGSDVVWAGGVMGGMMWCGNVVGQGDVVGQGHSRSRPMAVALQWGKRGSVWCPMVVQKVGGACPGV
jgi:hypothetical protein